MPVRSGDGASPSASSVLVVDDDEGVTDAFSRMLQLEGFRVHTASSARQGLDLALTERPSAVILDLRMPVVSGIDFLRELRTHPALAATPVAVVTGDYFVAEADANELRALGAILRFKPLWLDDLVKLARSLVAASQRPHP